VIALRLGDPASALVAEPGGRVDVLAGAPVDAIGSRTAAPATVVARDALVLRVPGEAAGPGPADPGTAPARSDEGAGLLGALGGGATGQATGAAPPGVPAGVVLVAVAPADARRLASISGVRTLSLTRRASAAG
jgi:hypothetical protein